MAGSVRVLLELLTNVYLFSFTSQIEEVELLDKKGYMTVSLALPKDGKVYLRKPEGIRDWFHVLQVSPKESFWFTMINKYNFFQTCTAKSKERLGIMKSSKDFWSKKQFTDSSSMEQWITARKRIGKSKSRQLRERT